MNPIFALTRKTDATNSIFLYDNTIHDLKNKAKKLYRLQNIGDYQTTEKNDFFIAVCSTQVAEAILQKKQFYTAYSLKTEMLEMIEIKKYVITLKNISGQQTKIELYGKTQTEMTGILFDIFYQNRLPDLSVQLVSITEVTE